MKQLIAILTLSLAAALALPAAAQNATAPAKDPGLLPKVFAGWELIGSPRVSADAAAADQPHAAVLKEYGFKDFSSATYTRSGGRQLTVKAIRFKDASGAYGAFTFYKAPEMLPEKFGDHGASLNERVLFYRANILVQATFAKVTAMSAAEARELADDLPVVTGPAANSPTLPSYLPQQSYVMNSAKYVLGPAGLESVGAPVSSDLVDFARDAEVTMGQYNASVGGATLMLIGYPTPQIAAERLRAIEAARPPTDASAPDQFLAKRTGPIIALVAGKISQGEGKSLLASVNYDAEVTWNQPTKLNPKDNIGNLIINNFLLIGMIFLFAIVLGITFGGFRILMKRLFPDRVFDRDLDIIQLKLTK